MSKNNKTAGLAANSKSFPAICRDCGTIESEEKDKTFCSCGGVFHVDSARCLSCGGRHDFNDAGQNCACGGTIAAKAVRCPGCGKYGSHKHLGESCPACNLDLIMEG